MAVKRRRKRNERPKQRIARKPPNSPSLRFTPTAWAKLLFWRDLGTTEIGGFGISAAHDLLLIEDVRLVKQSCTAVTVQFDDGAVADFFDEQVDAGRQPEQFSRIWIHTHPGNCPLASRVDEATFARVFGAYYWSIMAIVARGGETYARLQFRVGPGGAWEIPVEVDFAQPFAAADQAAWKRDYDTLVEAEPEFDLGGDFWSRTPPGDWPFHFEEWEDAYDGAFGLRSLRSTERTGADGAPTEYLGDGDWLRFDRPPSGIAVDGAGHPEAAVD